MSKACLLFGLCIDIIAGARVCVARGLDWSNSSILDSWSYYREREFVVASITCTVSDPGDLEPDLGLTKGQKIIVESLNTGESSFFVENEAYVTGFPAPLQFTGSDFIFDGTQFYDQNSRLSLRVEGQTAAPFSGSIWFNYVSPSKNRMAVGEIQDCQRLK